MLVGNAEYFAHCFLGQVGVALVYLFELLVDLGLNIEYILLLVGGVEQQVGNQLLVLLLILNQMSA